MTWILYKTVDKKPTVYALWDRNSPALESTGRIKVVRTYKLQNNEEYVELFKRIERVNDYLKSRRLRHTARVLPFRKPRRS